MSDHDINHPKAIVGAIAVMVMVPMFFLVMPMYVGALADDLGLSNERIGYLVSTELGMAALASLTALWWLRRVNWTRTLLILLVILGAANIASVVAGDNYLALMSLRTIAGFAAGANMAIALAALGDTKLADRNFAFGVVGQLGLSGILLLGLPWFVQRWGVDSVFVLFLVSALIALPLARLVPSSGKDPISPTRTNSRSLAPLWGLAATALIFTGQAAVWAFIERMGVSAGLSPTLIGFALGGSVLAGIIGALAASWLVGRYGRFWPMIIAMVGEVISLLLLAGGFDVAAYVAAVFLYSIFWNFWIPYQMGVVAETDVSGRFIALITFAQAAGIAVGPALVGPMIRDNNFDPVIWTGIAFAVLAMVFFLPVTRRRPGPFAHTTNET